jgi:DhnA family fructose-bisphosphate aldolase class Ia
MVADTIAVGGKGVVFGRNIWQHPNPAGMVRALRAVIHEDARAEEAAELLRG